MNFGTSTSSNIHVHSYIGPMADQLDSIQSRDLTVNFGHFPWRDIEICSGERPIYFCELSGVIHKKPDLTLRRSTKSGPMVGVSHFGRSRSFICGIGSDEVSMEWIEMQRQGLVRATVFEFEWAGRLYAIRKAKSEEVGESGVQGLLQTHFKVIDHASATIVGLYISKSGIGRRKGLLKMAANVTEDMEILVILGIMSWRCKISRDARRSAAASGGASA